jgi:hypothetical protein
MALQRDVVTGTPDHQGGVHALRVAIDLGAHDLEASGPRDVIEQVEIGPPPQQVVSSTRASRLASALGR